MTRVDFEFAASRSVVTARELLSGHIERPEVEGALRDAVDAWRSKVNDLNRSGQPIPETTARWAGRQQAALAHALLQSAYALEPEPSSTTSLASLEYENNLAELRDVAAGSGTTVASLHQRVVETVLGAASAHARRIGGLDATRRGLALEGIAASELLRRCAATLAWVCHVDHRLSSAPSARGLAIVAENRVMLGRDRSDTRFGEQATIGHEPLSRFTVSGLVNEAGWVDRPETPYSFARFTHGRFELRVHYRSMLSVGVASGRWLWARAKLEPGEGLPILVAEFEGLGEHGRTYWEDWLAAETRSVYDLAPSSLDVLWEMPHPAYRGGMPELTGRVSDVLTAVAA